MIIVSSFDKYGRYALLFAIIGDLLIPFILAPFYEGYGHTTMTISALGNPQSPVRILFNFWMLLEGLFLLFAVPAIYNYYKCSSKSLAGITITFIIIFGIGSCIFTCLFSVNETKDVSTTASKIHGFGSVIGFMVFLFILLLLSVLEFKSNHKAYAVIAKEGLWQQLKFR